ncbi:GntR family transcriptional regulator [Kitasatospora sp. NPDC058397]|uniref:GntR family transcriptional regulator n=1 Tax=unclassified Kitasatospora TaxID=2633591 RepID=UPI003664D487
MSSQEGPGGATYKRIADHYRQKILSGELPPGTKLPTLREVMEEWGVTMSTASAAMAELRREGLTIARPRHGTVVAEPGSASVAIRVRTYAATGRALGAREESRILEIGTTESEEGIALRLEIDPGSLVHVRQRLVSRDGTPAHVTSSYYPPFVVQAAPELTEPVSTGGSRELVAERLGVPQWHSLQEQTSRIATEQERELLELTDPAVVTQVIRTVSLKDGRVIEVAVKIIPGSTVLKTSESLATE